MFRRAANTLRPHVRSLHAHTSGAARAATLGNRRAVTAASILLGGSALWYTSRQYVHNDAIQIVEAGDRLKPKPAPLDKPKDPDALYSIVWGSNSQGTISPDKPSDDPLRTPAVAQWLNGVALRDLQLHQTHAACIDARGDVYQWGEGFFGKDGGSHAPKLTLREKNIVQLQLTEHKLCALSASGKVYVLATDITKQELPTGAPTPSSDGWWGTGWFWGEDEIVDFAEVHPSEKLARRESFVSIAAGQNHLLALTSKGRVFAHPINKWANYYGQLGFRKFSIPDPTAHGHINHQHDAHLHVELIPKSLADPFINSSRAPRAVPTAFTSDNLTAVDDKNIRFCSHLFEIPVLRGVEAAQIAAGSKSSFVRTPTGRVLAWGANEHGQLGLGSDVVLDVITVPTEVVLWRLTPHTTKSTCLNVTAGGDLTAFTVERDTGSGPTSTDVLMSGNGQYGGLGNSTYSNSQGAPIRVKAVSGLTQYNDRTRALEPIRPEELSISPTGHVLLALNSAENTGVGGRDVMVWGKNYESELGNGKKGSLPTPTTLEDPDGQRLMLMAKKAKEVKDLSGRTWKRGVKVEQRMVAGYENSVVYWKISD
ncbi:hypothetical protein NLJ89_g8163 [Agrocybe chaxingu]|uniref:Uncharacterized protein n=1 Tax=Agrocybe chaxingu TaxID=84603 RepID=A0A9W8JVW4_9AGAR|nr:hypothetical protein NLJ89_g8163 [Agrocybe chaxingu]